ncbi:hypothetical protein Tco_0256018 [Tanacetum coccineum]
MENLHKFKLEANVVINLSFKLSSFDFAVDITDDAEDTSLQRPKPNISKQDSQHSEVEKRVYTRNKSGSCGHRWKQSDCANCIWYMQRGNRSMLVMVDVRIKMLGGNPNLLFLSDMACCYSLA